MIRDETKVGLFVLVGIIIFAMAAIFLEGISIAKGYEIKIIFDYAEGLPERGPVKIAGVEVGKIKEITLEQDKAIVTVIMKPQVRLFKDAKAKIISVGMVGNKSVECTAGSSSLPRLNDGDFIFGEGSMRLESILESANASIDSIVEQFKIFEKGGQLDRELTGIVTNLESITRKLNSSLGKDGETIKKTLDNINMVSKDINVISERVKAMEIDDSVLSKLIADKDLGQRTENIIKSLEKVTKNLEKRLK